MHAYKKQGDFVVHRIVLSALKALGFIGFFYTSLGSKNIGNAFLNAKKLCGAIKTHYNSYGAFPAGYLTYPTRLKQ